MAFVFKAAGHRSIFPSEAHSLQGGWNSAGALLGARAPAQSRSLLWGSSWRDGAQLPVPSPAVHCPAPRGSPECPRPTSSSASFPKFPSAKAPPSLEARPCSAQDDGYLFKWLPCHLAPRPEVPFSVDRCEQPVCRAGTLVLPPPPGPRTFPASQDRLRLRK